jgi:uncharacterized protein
MDKHTRKLILFLVFTFLWTYAFYAPIAIGRHDVGQMPYTVLLIFGGMGPSVVGVSMILLDGDREQRRDYFRRCFSIRLIRPRWWAVILLVFPACAAVSIALNAGLGGTMPEFAMLKALAANPVSIPLAAFISFMSGPWSEEFGWRGYALDPLLKRLGTVRGTLMLAFFWAIWHLPLYFMAGTWHGEMGFRPAGFWSFMGLSVGLSLIMTIVYLQTGRSILSGMLLHFTSNFSAQLIAPAWDAFEITRVLVILAVGAAFAVVAVKGRWRTKSAPPDRGRQGQAGAGLGLQ